MEPQHNYIIMMPGLLRMQTLSVRVWENAVVPLVSGRAGAT